MNHTTARRTALAASLIAGALVLTGCGDGTGADHGSMMGSTDSSAGASTGPQDTFNDADVTFAAGMIPHHRQALVMAELAEGRAADPRVQDLASRIEAAQGPEIETLTGWLDQWGADPMDGMGHDGMGHDGMGTDGTGHGDGMMSEQDMAALMSASGADFDRLFLEQMIVHHTGAVRMGGTQIADGQNADAIALAETIRDSQSAEIAEMEQLLTELGG